MTSEKKKITWTFLLSLNFMQQKISLVVWWMDGRVLNEQHSSFHFFFSLVVAFLNIISWWMNLWWWWCEWMIESEFRKEINNKTIFFFVCLFGWYSNENKNQIEKPYENMERIRFFSFSLWNADKFVNQKTWCGCGW